MIILIWFICWKMLCGSQCRKCRRIMEITDFTSPHLLQMAQGPPFLGRFLRGSSWSICRAKTLCCSTILPDHEAATGRLHILQLCRGTAGSITPPAPDLVHKTVCSSILDLIMGAKSMVGVVGMCLFPGRGIVIIFHLFCIISPVSSECQN